MTEEEVLASAYTMPITSPAFPKPPFRFVDREFVIITYRTDPKELSRVIPAPLQPADPIVKYEFINMADASGLGTFTETGQVLPVTFKGQPGGFTHAMYLDSEAGIASGRELLGFPKVLAQPKLEVRNDALVGTLDYNGVRVVTATMAYKYYPVDLETVGKAVATPGYLLKIVPHVDTKPRICELVKYRVSDVHIKGAWSGPASLELHPHCFAPVSRLPVLEVLSALHILCDLSITSGEVVHDYLSSKSLQEISS